MLDSAAGNALVCPMSTTRREFLLGGISATAWTSLYGRSPSRDTPRLRLGVMSDIHVQRKDDSPSRLFKRALNWCRAQDVDGVLLAGDLTEEGLEEQLEYVAETYFSFFPGDKGRDGRDVGRLVITGNHDIGEFWYRRLKDRGEPVVAEFRSRSLTHHRDRIWRKCWNEPWEPIFRKSVNGMAFVGAHWSCWSEKTLADFFAKNPMEPGRPFLYAQHSHPRGTVYGAIQGDVDNGSSTKFFSDKPGAIVFSGHSHRPVRDSRAIWQGGFTSIATGAVSQAFVASGCENSTFRIGREGVSHMQMFDGRDSATVLLVDFYADRLVVRRQNVVHDERIADDWVVPLPVDGTWAFEPRSAAARAPEFPADAKVSVEVCDGKNRRREPERQVVVKFPRALPSTGDTMTEKYRVTVVADGKDVLSRTVFARGHFYDEERVRKLVKEESCVFGSDEIPPGSSFRVAPIDEWGHVGREIAS